MASFLFLPVDNNIFISVCNYFFFAFISCIYKDPLQLPKNPTVNSVGNIIFTDENILPKYVVKLGQMHCFLKERHEIPCSTSSFLHFFPGSDKSGINGKCFRRRSFVTCFSGSSIRAWQQEAQAEENNIISCSVHAN